VFTLSFLHDNKMRHKDIKPPNILSKQDEVYLTDFGVSLDWTELGHSTAQGPPTITPRYRAPEVVAFEPRNSSSDIWSLGCVFLEMWTVLRGETMKELTRHMRSMPYHSAEVDIESWVDRVEALPGPNRITYPYCGYSIC
jgi:serine/threonine protein kinase